MIAAPGAVEGSGHRIERMLTGGNFECFDDVEVELGTAAFFGGPNNLPRPYFKRWPRGWHCGSECGRKWGWRARSPRHAAAAVRTGPTGVPSIVKEITNDA